VAATTGGDTGEGTGLDFDLGGFDDAQTVPSLQPAREEAAPAQAGSETGGETGLDFDLGAIDAAAEEAEGLASGAETGLDFDLREPTEAPAAGAASGGGSGLDFDLGDASTLGGEQAGAASALDFDLGAATGAGGGSQGAGSVLDFDLGAASSGGEASAIDFDFGDTGSAGGSSALDLDFDLGDTGSAGGSSALDLDFDLGDTGPAGEASDAGQGSALDLDLGDTASLGETRAAEDSEDEARTQPVLPDLGGGGLESDLDLDLGAGGDDSLGMTSSLDLDLTTDLPEDMASGPATEIGGTSETGLDLPDMQLDTLSMDTQPEGAFETVKLQAGDGGEDTGALGGSGVDTEFRDIFGAGSSSGSGSGLDLDLDLGEAGGDEFISPDSSAEEAFPDTEFLLPDMGEGSEGGLDDTLLGGGADEMQTKLDLAQAYIDMDDKDGAKALLGEVMAGGDEAQKSAASDMLAGLG
jgi:pilus assembly protein FimV